jgi:hypothetical protein
MQPHAAASRRHASLTVDLDELLLYKPLLREELQHVLALVALQLDHVAQLGVVHHSAVAAKLRAWGHLRAARVRTGSRAGSAGRAGGTLVVL